MRQELTEVKPLWVEKSIKLPYNIRRYNERGMRNYHTFLNGQVHYFPSVTSITKEVMPTNEGLIRWISEHGEKRAKEMAKEAANYGTLMHIAMSNFLVRGYFDFDTVDDLIESYILEERIKHSTYGWADRLKSDIKAFEVFVKEHKIKPIAIEIPLMSFKMGIAGTIDLVCEMTIGTGQNGAILKSDIKYNKEGEIILDKTFRITVVIDWKSGRNGFYPEHEVQLHLYKPIWEENFPNIQIDSVYNWAPKDWETEPDYKLKCQDDSKERFLIGDYLNIFRVKIASKSDKQHPIICGMAYLDSAIEPVQFETTEEHLKKRFYKSESESERERGNGNREEPEEIKILDAVIDASANAYKSAIRLGKMPAGVDENGRHKWHPIIETEGLEGQEKIVHRLENLIEKQQEINMMLAKRDADFKNATLPQKENATSPQKEKATSPQPSPNGEGEQPIIQEKDMDLVVAVRNKVNAKKNGTTSPQPSPNGEGVKQGTLGTNGTDLAKNDQPEVSDVDAEVRDIFNKFNEV